MALASNNLWVASAAIIDRLRLNPNYAGRDADLLDNGGADVPRGYVEANGVALNSGGTLFVQNTRRRAGHVRDRARFRRRHRRPGRAHRPLDRPRRRRPSPPSAGA